MCCFSNAAQSGGGLYLAGTTGFADFVACTLDSNAAAHDGGFTYVLAGRLTIRESVITNGTAVYEGAAVYSAYGINVIASIVSNFGFPENEADCYDNDEGARDYFLETCAYYTSFEEYDEVGYACGAADDSDFSAALMCCACGGGSFLFPGQRTVFYHASSGEVLLLDSVESRNNDLPFVFAEHESSVAVRNCVGLNANDVSAAAVLDCEAQAGYCFADYCTNIAIGFEVNMHYGRPLL